LFKKRTKKQQDKEEGEGEEDQPTPTPGHKRALLQPETNRDKYLAVLKNEDNKIKQNVSREIMITDGGGEDQEKTRRS
jgi:hypothetical protein